MNNMISAISPNINFQARLVKDSKAKFYDASAPHLKKTQPGSIIEIDPNSKSDIGAIEAAVKDWGEGDSYGKVIANDAKTISKFPRSKQLSKIIAFTLQDKDFENLDSDKIFGLCEVTILDKGKVEINYLQSKPKSAVKVGERVHGNIGKSIVNMLKEKGFSRIFVQAAYNAANFYEKMNFKIIDVNKLIYVWQKARQLDKIQKAVRFGQSIPHIGGKIRFKI